MDRRGLYWISPGDLQPQYLVPLFFPPILIYACLASLANSLCRDRKRRLMLRVSNALHCCQKYGRGRLDNLLYCDTLKPLRWSWPYLLWLAVILFSAYPWPVLLQSRHANEVRKTSKVVDASREQRHGKRKRGQALTRHAKATLKTSQRLCSREKNTTVVRKHNISSWASSSRWNVLRLVAW